VAFVVLLATMPGPLGTGTRPAAAAPGTCPVASGMKPLIRGLVDRTVIPPAAGLQAGAIEVKWSDLEPSGPGLVAGNPIDAAIAAAGCQTPLRLRVQAGIAAPEWVKQASGGDVSVTNPFDGSTGTVGRFWTDSFRQSYDHLQSELAAAYDSVPNLDEVVVSRCSMFYPEPFLRGTSVKSNVTNLLAAGYKLATDQQCQLEEIDSSVSHWTTARVGVSFNPYQVINADGTVGPSESYTEQVMGYCRYTAGSRCVLENDSIRDPISGLPSLYGQMYSAMSGAAGPVHVTVGGLDVMVALGAPLAFQTAVEANIGDFWGTLIWARQHHAASVELPVDPTYPTTGGTGAPPWQTIAEVAQWFEENATITVTPLAAVEGTTTTGMGLANLKLDELAALDTMAGYGDVGSVPFDSVTAVVGWPDGVMEAALLTTGQSGPAASVTCSQQRWCNVAIESGGHALADEAPATPAVVRVSLAIGGVAYVPANGVSPTAAPAVSVADQPLDPSATPYTFTPQAQSRFSGLIGSFHDENELATPTVAGGHEYSVSIVWGDGYPADTMSATYVIGSCGASPGPAAGQGCQVAVSGAHTYVNPGAYSVTTTIHDGAGSNTLSFTSTANVGASGSACTAAGLTSDKTSPRQSGTIVTFTATSSPCTNPEYEFFVQATGGPWILGQAYGSANYVWNTAGDGATSYSVDVWVREKGSTVSQQAYFVMPYTLSTPLTCTAANLTASPTSPQPTGTTVAFTATSSTCSQPQYLFYVQATGGPWILGRGYGSDTYVWKTTGDAKTTYNIDVWVRQNGSTATYETFYMIPYRLS
jgi:hypothetical protein